MKTTKLPQSAWNDAQAAGSQSQSVNQSESYYPTCDKNKQTGRASNDDLYKNSFGKDSFNKGLFNKVVTVNMLINETAPPTISSAYKKAANKNAFSKKASQQIEGVSTAAMYSSSALLSNEQLMNDRVANKASKIAQPSSDIHMPIKNLNIGKQQHDNISADITAQIPERVFMNGLIKHTAIALAIIIPLAAFSAYAAPQNMPMNAINESKNQVIEPSSVIHNSASTPTTVDSVDLEQYAGTWYEIGRLPMYFQRKCASDVTATYTGKADGSGIDVLNQCRKQDGLMMSANGLAKAVDNSGSKLKVTFLPSWIRWLPVGRADYWVLARDANYQTALVGTPDKKYLWLLARTPNISQQTYSKYSQIAQQQGYDLKEFKLTPQTNQHVKLVP
ncbi:lipocalin family protein [Psychrobacter sp. 16-MNA-CIBAN-0192]|uniref:lipocalin family protein n=1 Tax=Psychrobacter sp. 16-MNA-CIBAN-0192 TaxID=3140448 RepID=UPI00332382CE